MDTSTRPTVDYKFGSPLGNACPRQGRAKFCVYDIPGAVGMAKTLLMDLSCCSK